MSRIYKKPELLNLISQAIFECNWKVIYLNNEYPFKIKIFNDNDTDSYFVKISIYNMTHGGGKKRAKNEYRIQIKEPKFEKEQGYKTLILGYYDKLQVFAGFDISKHSGAVGYSSSFQIREECLNQASISGFSPCNKENGEVAIAFRPEIFVEYVRNLEQLHRFGEGSPQDFEILKEVTEKELVINEDIIQQVTTKPRQTVIQTISKKQRDNNFRAKILRAYNNRCAFSGIQLKLVEAAHIVPVSYETSTDETSNGIALSAIHHKAYDKGLITFDENYKIMFKESEKVKLKELNLHGGLDKFVSDLRPVVDLPPNKLDKPNIEYVKMANKLRGWN